MVVWVNRRDDSVAVARRGRSTWRRIAALLAAVTAGLVLAGCSSGSDDLVVVQADSTYWPWQTSPPTSTPPPVAPAAPSTATVTISPGPTETPTDTPTASPSPTTSAPPPDSSTPSDSGGPSGDSGGAGAPVKQLANEVIALTNAEREKAGCSALANNRVLRSVATAHSQDMAERNYFSHTSPEGDGPGDRAEDAGYEGYTGENIAMGYTTAKAVVDGWMRSDGHRQNIVNCESNVIGVGVADSSRGLYWTQMFGRS